MVGDSLKDADLGDLQREYDAVNRRLRETMAARTVLYAAATGDGPVPLLTVVAPGMDIPVDVSMATGAEREELFILLTNIVQNQAVAAWRKAKAVSDAAGDLLDQMEGETDVAVDHEMLAKDRELAEILAEERASA